MEPPESPRKSRRTTSNSDTTSGTDQPEAEATPKKTTAKPRAKKVTETIPESPTMEAEKPAKSTKPKAAAPKSAEKIEGEELPVKMVVNFAPPEPTFEVMPETKLEEEEEKPATPKGSFPLADKVTLPPKSTEPVPALAKPVSLPMSESSAPIAAKQAKVDAAPPSLSTAPRPSVTAVKPDSAPAIATLRTLLIRNGEIIGKTGKNLREQSGPWLEKTSSQIGRVKVGSESVSDYTKRITPAMHRTGSWIDERFVHLQHQLEQSDTAVLAYTLILIAVIMLVTLILWQFWRAG